MGFLYCLNVIVFVTSSSTCKTYPPTVNTIALYNGCNVDMISKCFGDAVFPIITTPAIIKFGMYAYLKFLNDSTASTINDDSNAMAWMKNFGSPNGMPKAPTMQIDTRTETRYFWILLILVSNHM